jgi:hypothetical protein
MLMPLKLNAIFSGGYAIRKIRIHYSKPTPTLLFADGSMSVQRVRWLSQRILIHCSNILCLAISRRVEDKPLSAIKSCTRSRANLGGGPVLGMVARRMLVFFMYGRFRVTA